MVFPGQHLCSLPRDFPYKSLLNPYLKNHNLWAVDVHLDGGCSFICSEDHGRPCSGCDGARIGLQTESPSALGIGLSRRPCGQAEAMHTIVRHLVERWEFRNITHSHIITIKQPQKSSSILLSPQHSKFAPELSLGAHSVLTTKVPSHLSILFNSE